jgi:MFS family permease
VNSSISAALTGFAAGISISVVMGGFISARSVLLQKHYRYGLLFGTALIGLGMVSAVAVEYPIWLSAMLLWVHDVGRGLSDPLRRLALNHEVTNQIRSTVNSSISAALTGFAAIGGVTGSILTNAYGIHNTWVIMGGVIAFSTIPLLLYLRSKEKTEARTF